MNQLAFMSPDAWGPFFSLLTAAIMASWALIRWTANFKKKRHLTPEESHAQDRKLYDLCMQVGFELGAIRVYVSHYHNGEFFYSGDPAQRKDRAIEWVRPGTDPVADHYKNVLTSTIPDEMDLVLKDGPSFTRVVDLPQGTFRFYCIRDRSQAIARCGIWKKINGKDELIAIVGADFDVTIEPPNIYRLTECAGLVSLELSADRKRK